ncbi:MAG: flagellar biosynthetic protein FliR [Chloroflexi bacterium]|nr:flagellar biosynthetic protein FliR [Chloroflexota bacterium]
MDVSVIQAQLFFLSLSRILAAIIYVPVLGGRNVPNVVKIGFGLVLTMIIIPTLPQPEYSEAMPAVVYGFAMAKEVIIGALAGFAALLTFNALQITGNLMGIVSGFSSANILNPALEDNGTAMDQMFLITAFLVFLAVNGHHLFLLGLERTFTIIPVNSPLPEFSLTNYLRMASQFITAGVQMALPVVGALLLTDITLGLLARVAPQVHVFFLGIPLKIGIGLVALALTIIMLAPNLYNIFTHIGEYTLKLLGA